MTTSGGTSRPTQAESQDAPTQVNAPAVDGPAHPAEAPRPDAGHPTGSSGSTTGGARGSSAYDVAAALRAQAGRAAAATRGAAQRVQEAVAPTPLPPEEGGPASPNGTGSSPVRATPAATTAGTPARPAAPSTSASSQPYATGPGPAATGAPAAAPPAAAAAAAASARSAAPARPQPTAVAPVTAASRPRPAAAPPQAASPAPAPRRSGRVRKARLRLLRLDPWSVMKTAFLLSVALGIMLFVAVAVLWSVLDAAGVFGAVGDVVRDITASETSAGIDVEGAVAMSRVLGFTTLVAVVDVVLVTALATLGAFLYNLSASLLGGLEVTLAEDD